MWQNQAAHLSKKNYECDDNTFEFEHDYIFMFDNEVSEKTTTELDNALEENYMTFYVKMINGKTIRQKCEGKQTAAITADEVERRSLIPRGMTYLVHHGKVMNEKKTIEENNIVTETTIDMSLGLLGGMEKSELMDTLESDEDGEKKEVG